MVVGALGAPPPIMAQDTEPLPLSEQAIQAVEELAS